MPYSTVVETLTFSSKDYYHVTKQHSKMSSTYFYIGTFCRCGWCLKGKKKLFQWFLQQMTCQKPAWKRKCIFQKHSVYWQAGLTNGILRTDLYTAVPGKIKWPMLLLWRLNWKWIIATAKLNLRVQVILEHAFVVIGTGFLKCKTLKSWKK